MRFSLNRGESRNPIPIRRAHAEPRLESPIEKTRESTVAHHDGILKALRSGTEERAVTVVREQIEDWRCPFPHSQR